jgi:hypothetical protein
MLALTAPRPISPTASFRQVMCISIDVPADKSYTVVIPVPSFRASDSIRSDIKVFNSIGDYGMSFFSHLEQVTTSQQYRSLCNHIATIPIILYATMSMLTFSRHSAKASAVYPQRA